MTADLNVPRALIANLESLYVSDSEGVHVFAGGERTVLHDGLSVEAFLLNGDEIFGLDVDVGRIVRFVGDEIDAVVEIDGLMAADVADSGLLLSDGTAVYRLNPDGALNPLLSERETILSVDGTEDGFLWTEVRREGRPCCVSTRIPKRSSLCSTKTRYPTHCGCGGSKPSVLMPPCFSSALMAGPSAHCSVDIASKAAASNVLGIAPQEHLMSMLQTHPFFGGLSTDSFNGLMVQ